MNIQSMTSKNFGSYGDLVLTNLKGFKMITGPTGSGKSTIFDLIPWCLWGRTAKDGGIDDVRKWGSNNATLVEITFDSFSVTRIRSKGENDLYIKKNGAMSRGSTIPDTQKIVNQELGSYEDFILSSYYHEFSEISNFFTLSAKQRRNITESLVDLSLPVRVKENANEYKKELKETQAKLKINIEIHRGKLDTSINIDSSLRKKSKDWDTSHALKVKELIELDKNFEKSKSENLLVQKNKLSEYEENRNLMISIDTKELEVLNSEISPTHYYEDEIRKTQNILDKINADRCSTCGGPKSDTNKTLYMTQLHDWKSLLRDNDQKKIKVVQLSLSIERHKTTENPHKKTLEQEYKSENKFKDLLENLKAENNPYELRGKEQNVDITHLRNNVEDLQNELNLISRDIADTDTLQELLEKLRLSMISNMISVIETKSNDYLSRFFDGEFRLNLNVSEKDSLETEIYKDGVKCPFYQLSKGQRQILKVCFSLATIHYKNETFFKNCGILFLDEIFDGMDDSLKLKGLNLLRSLSDSYDVLLTDHSETLKAMVDDKIHVRIESGESYASVE